MKTVAFVSQKGGSGKTTLCIHYAVVAAESGLKVAIIDTDPQGSSTAWGASREKDFPVVATCSASRVNEALAAAQNDGFDLAIIDAAPHLDPGVARIASAADFIVIPVRPSPLDIQTAHRAAAVAKTSGKPYGFVLNGCPPRGPEVPEACQVLKELGGEICPSVIGDRKAYARAVGSGESVTEFDPKGSAATEIRTFKRWIDLFIAEEKNQ